MNRCIQSLPGTALASYEFPDFTSIQDPEQIEFYVQLGNEIPSSTFVTQLGVENIVWISHPNSQIRQLTYQQLTDLYQGKDPGLANLTGSQEDIELNIWVYPPNNVLTKFLWDKIDLSKSFLTTAYVAPDPEAMLEAVSEDVHGLGFVPESWLQNPIMAQNFNKITIIDTPGFKFQPVIPVFSVSTTEPKSTGREALLCFKERIFETP